MAAAPPLGPGSPLLVVARPARLGRPGLRGRRRRPTHPAVAVRRAPAGPGDGRHHGGRPDPGPGRDPTIGERLQDSFVGWRRLAAAARRRRRRPGRPGPVGGPPPGPAGRPGGGLAGGPPRARPCSTPTCGPTTCCLTPTRVVAVDWPWACVGAAWVDLLLLLPSVTMQGGPDPAADLRHPPGGRRRRPVGGHHRPGRLGRLPGRRRPPAGPARSPHPPGLPGRAGRGRPRLAAAADRLALTALGGRPGIG